VSIDHNGSGGSIGSARTRVSLPQVHWYLPACRNRPQAFGSATDESKEAVRIPVTWSPELNGGRQG